MKEPRSHIEGATPSAAIWQLWRIVPRPVHAAGPAPITRTGGSRSKTFSCPARSSGSSIGCTS